MSYVEIFPMEQQLSCGFKYQVQVKVMKGNLFWLNNSGKSWEALKIVVGKNFLNFLINYFMLNISGYMLQLQTVLFRIAGQFGRLLFSLDNTIIIAF